jgi:PAS domain-containing protein
MSFRRKFSLEFSRVVNHLQRSRPGVRHATGAPSYQDAATTMEKLDAALNNMSHGLCMFGPDNRLLRWNDRYVKMYKLAPDSLGVGCTLDEMLEARKAAGTAYRDLGGSCRRARERGRRPLNWSNRLRCAVALSPAAVSVHRLFGL